MLSWRIDDGSGGVHATMHATAETAPRRTTGLLRTYKNLLPGFVRRTVPDARPRRAGPRFSFWSALPLFATIDCVVVTSVVPGR